MHFYSVYKPYYYPNKNKDDLKIPDVRLSRPKISNQTDAREAKIYYIENMTTGFDVGYEGELFKNKFKSYQHFENIKLPIRFNFNKNKNKIKSNISKNSFKKNIIKAKKIILEGCLSSSS